MRDSVFEALKSGASLLVASQRQVRTLQIAYARRMLDEERLAWQSPDLLTWNAWLERYWDEFTAPSLAKEQLVTRTLLSPVQEAMLWESVIGDSSFGDGLLQTSATAQTVQDAWRLSWEWTIPLPLPDAAPNEDVRAFAIWSRDFDERCRAQGWQDRARLADAIIEALASGCLNAPKRLLLFGFEEHTPQQERLLEILRRAGTVVEPIDAYPMPNTVVRYELAGPLEEIAAAAHWARERLKAGASRIGVIVPDLSAMRPQVVRIFDDTFVPGAVLPGSANAIRPYNLSLGQALSQYPIVHTALQILELGKGELACEETGSLLRSPFLGGATEEWPQRALLDVACRQAEPLVRINGLLRLAQDQDREGGWRAHSAPMLAARLKNWRALLDSFPKKQLPSAWAESFARGLLALGWPGDRPLDSDEYQTVEAWRELLSVLSTLDEVTNRIGYAEAFSTLVHMAGERIFQPKTPEVPVQVMGLLEAAGLEFDGLWITGLHDTAWPDKPRPNPFLPIELQRRYNLPHASAARELNFARRLTGWLLASAPEVIVSHARHSGDENLRPSPLIAHLPAKETETPCVIGALHQLVHESRPSLEQISDERAASLVAGTEARRGTSVFKDQAACPFRAFAHARLGARALDEPEPGLDAIDRGNLLHGVMKGLWLNLKSHANLCAFPEEAVRLAVREAVAGAIAEMARERPQTFTVRFVALEQARLEQLVLGWLEIEKQRAPFTVVFPEKEQMASYGGLTIRIVPDRIDEIEGGARVVIDYKTGTPKINQWFGDRPDEPQLPIYALAQNNVAAVAFAQIRKDDTRFIGIAAEAGLASGMEPVDEIKEAAALGSWKELLAEWRRVIEALGEAFRTGDARVAPKDGTRTCEYCDVGPLCRIRELEEDLQVGSGDET
ncbi:PD-(D/E)XK nuclease family protein [Sulfuricaulis sp.]|uniref:PD-(D/E)XK nuclease family protein n=1 Tax=Sulfuricaulis sp. TaxID=2003553 RepID=UPI003559C515